MASLVELGRALKPLLGLIPLKSKYHILFSNSLQSNGLVWRDRFGGQWEPGLES